MENRYFFKPSLRNDMFGALLFEQTHEAPSRKQRVVRFQAHGFRPPPV